jgi:curved DNA-binding protein CbpA
MKRFMESNFYQILEVPVDASPSQIRRAYRDGLEVYGQKSLLTYALFSDEERTVILQRMQEAYNTLMDRTKRAQYDADLREKSDMTNTPSDTRVKESS